MPRICRAAFVGYIGILSAVAGAALPDGTTYSVVGANRGNSGGDYIQMDMNSTRKGDTTPSAWLRQVPMLTAADLHAAVADGYEPPCPEGTGGGGGGGGGSDEVSLSSNAYYAEGSIPVDVHVLRSGGLVGTCSVHYATANGTAIAGTDYTAESGTLSFANGESDKVITVPVSYTGNAQLAFTITISSPSGCVLVSPVTATVNLIGQVLLSSVRMDTDYTRAYLYNVPQNKVYAYYLARTGGATGTPTDQATRGCPTVRVSRNAIVSVWGMASNVGGDPGNNPSNIYVNLYSMSTLLNQGPAYSNGASGVSGALKVNPYANFMLTLPPSSASTTRYDINTLWIVPYTEKNCLIVGTYATWLINLASGTVQASWLNPGPSWVVTGDNTRTGSIVQPFVKPGTPADVLVAYISDVANGSGPAIGRYLEINANTGALVHNYDNPFYLQVHSNKAMPTKIVPVYFPQVDSGTTFGLMLFGHIVGGSSQWQHGHCVVSTCQSSNPGPDGDYCVAPNHPGICPTQWSWSTCTMDAYNGNRFAAYGGKSGTLNDISLHTCSPCEPVTQTGTEIFSELVGTTFDNTYPMSFGMNDGSWFVANDSGVLAKTQTVYAASTTVCLTGGSLLSYTSSTYGGITGASDGRFNACGLSDTSFFYRAPPSGGVSTLYEIKISDGSTLHSVNERDTTWNAHTKDSAFNTSWPRCSENGLTQSNTWVDGALWSPRKVLQTLP